MNAQLHRRRVSTAALLTALSLIVGAGAASAIPGDESNALAVRNAASTVAPEDGDHSHNDADENGDLHSSDASIHHRVASTDTCTQPGTQVEDADQAHNDADAQGDIQSSVNSIHKRDLLPACPNPGTTGGGTDTTQTGGTGGTGGSGGTGSGVDSTTKAPAVTPPTSATNPTATTPTDVPSSVTPDADKPATTPAKGRKPTSVNSGSLTANGCPTSAVGPRAIGSISLAGVAVPLKPVAIPASGVFTPLGSAAVASVSRAHQPLSAKQGTTLIAWHNTYGRNCDGALNVLLQKRIGDTFKLRSASGAVTTFRIKTIGTVAKGAYPDKWFRMTGPRQLVLMTCANLLRGQYMSNKVYIAVPVA